MHSATRSAFFGLTLAAGAAVVLPARAQDLDLDDAPSKAAPDAGFGSAHPPPPATIKGHAYTLAECLALTDRNHPNLWAARARLAFVHAQLDEAKWTPFWQWSANFAFGVLPPVGGTPLYNAAPLTLRNLTFSDSVYPLVHFDINGAFPLYTFGKIAAAREAAEAQVRVNEWDLEKLRQQVRMDVRRAYFGLMLARDAHYLVDEVLSRLDKAMEAIAQRLAKGDPAFSDADRLRLDVYKDEVRARAGETTRGETYAIAALRFLTGVETAFEVPDEPMKRPDTPLAPVVSYLEAARLFRPEVNMARAGVAARVAQVDWARARYLPDIGLQLSADITRAPSSVPQNNVWVNDPLNHFFLLGGVGARWGLDFLPNAARVVQAESQLEETRALQRLALGGLAVEVENAYASVLEAKTREESWDNAEHRAKEWVSIVSDMMDLGNADERSLTDPLRTYVYARVNHLYALMDLNVTMSQLALASGWDSAAPTGG